MNGDKFSSFGQISIVKKNLSILSLELCLCFSFGIFIVVIIIIIVINIINRRYYPMSKWNYFVVVFQFFKIDISHCCTYSICDMIKLVKIVFFRKKQKRQKQQMTMMCVTINKKINGNFFSLKKSF